MHGIMALRVWAAGNVDELDRHSGISPVGLCRRTVVDVNVDTPYRHTHMNKNDF